MMAPGRRSPVNMWRRCAPGSVRSGDAVVIVGERQAPAMQENAARCVRMQMNPVPRWTRASSSGCQSRCSDLVFRAGQRSKANRQRSVRHLSISVPWWRSLRRRAAELFCRRCAGAAVVHGADDGLTPEKLADAIQQAPAVPIAVVVMASGAMSLLDLVSVTSRVGPRSGAVVSLPMLSMTQCLAALAVHDPTNRPSADAYAMAEAATGARVRGSLTIAETKMMTLAGTCGGGHSPAVIGDVRW